MFFEASQPRLPGSAMMGSGKRRCLFLERNCLCSFYALGYSVRTAPWLAATVLAEATVGIKLFLWVVPALLIPVCPPSDSWYVDLSGILCVKQGILCWVVFQLVRLLRWETSPWCWLLMWFWFYSDNIWVCGLWFRVTISRLTLQGILRVIQVNNFETFNVFNQEYFFPVSKLNLMWNSKIIAERLWFTWGRPGSVCADPFPFTSSR